MSQSKHWCFTLFTNNFQNGEFREDNIDGLNRILEGTFNSRTEFVNYVSWQFERGEGTENLHIQGYIEVKKSSKFTAIQAIGGPFLRAHFEHRRGSRDQARDYTRKVESRVAGPFEWGEWVPNAQGKRNDLGAVSSIIVGGGGIKRVADEYPQEFIKFHRGIEKLQELHDLSKPIDNPGNPRGWQIEFEKIIETEVHDRWVFWVWDQEGNKGKSHFARYLVSKHGQQNVFYANGGKHDRLTYCYRGQSYIIFDFARDVGGDPQSGDRVPYSVIEQIKNGTRGAGGMWGTGAAFFKIPRLICFSNFPPDTTKLSRDRWRIYEIVGDELDFQQV